MWLAKSQSIPKITSSSCKGRHIRFTLYLRHSTSTGHLAHKDDVLTKPDVGVDTTSSQYSSPTDKPRRFTQASDTKECVAPKSYSTRQDFPAIIQWPITRLPKPVASPPVKAYTLLDAWGLFPPILCWFLAGAKTGVRVTVFARVAQSLLKWPSLPQLLHLLKPASWGQAFLLCGLLFRWTQDSGVTIRNALDEEQLTWNKDAFEQTWRSRWRSKP